MSGIGTDETAWRTWPAISALPRLPLPTGRIVVLSAHPDDEVLGAGGLIARLAGTAAELSFVTATDGESSHPHAPLEPAALGARRAIELVDALTALGHPRPTISRLRLPDADLEAHRQDLTSAVRRLTDDADLVLSPALVDGHTDHQTLARVALDVCSGRTPVWQFPIWLWHWTAPGAAGVDWERAGRIDMMADVANRKRAALRCFTTQLSPLPGDPSADVILPPDALAHFERPFEVFLR